MELLKETKFKMPRLLYNFYQERAFISHQDKLGFKQLWERCVLLLTTLKSCCSAAESQTGPAACVESNIVGKVCTPVLQKLGGDSYPLMDPWSAGHLAGIILHSLDCDFISIIAHQLCGFAGDTNSSWHLQDFTLCGPRNLEPVLVFSRKGLGFPGSQWLWGRESWEFRPYLV